MKKILLIIEDDFELMGNGLGNTAYHQYIPANILQNICEEIGVRMTFMVDVAQIITMKKYAENNPDIKLQISLWESSLKQMIERDFDVQLHLHPQWLDASYKKPFFYLNDNWNIGRYDKSRQEYLIKNSVEYLSKLLTPIKNDYKIHSFKAGSWGMQPSQNLFELFNQYHFKVILGVRKDMYIPSAGIDYRGLEEDTLPYYPNFKDVTKIGTKGNLIVIPLTYYAPDVLTLGKLAAHLLKRKFIDTTNLDFFYNKPIPKEISTLKGIPNKKHFKPSIHPYLTHLKMSNEPFSYLKKSFDNVYSRLSKLDMNGIPVIMESHTKHYINNYHNIRQFLRYIKETYNNEVEFITLTDFVNKYQNNISIKHNENM